MPFTEIDTAGIARAVAQIVEQPDDRADVFLERREEVALPGEDATPGLRVWRESGLAVRLARGEQVWLAGRDAVDAEAFRDAVRRVARAVPRASYPLPKLRVEPWDEPPAALEVVAFPAAVRRAARDRQVRGAYRLDVRRHRRWVQVVGSRLVSPIEHESYYSVAVEMPSGRFGGLFTALDETAADQVARALARSARCAGAAPPERGRGPCVLGPAAAAVLLHEAVAHALEADTLALGGHPEAAIGVVLGGGTLDVLDDPGSAPPGVRRTVDDEGTPVLRRWLLRGGVVEQPLCDSGWARSSDVLAAGAGRRADRHWAPAPRSTHLELLAGDVSNAELLADAEGGCYFPQAERGQLDPLTGRFSLRFPFGYRIRGQVAANPIGPCTLVGHVSDLLGAVTGLGDEARVAGAGWCAKDGMRLPVWATVPPMRLEPAEIQP